MTKKINLVAEIKDSDLHIGVNYPKGVDPELAKAATEELIAIFEKYSELLED